jgi:hypothetical protein
VWTDELHDLFVKAYDSLGDGMVAYILSHVLARLANLILIQQLPKGWCLLCSVLNT